MERVGRVGTDTQTAVETLARKLGGALDVRPHGAPRVCLPRAAIFWTSTSYFRARAARIWSFTLPCRTLAPIATRTDSSMW